MAKARIKAAFRRHRRLCIRCCEDLLIVLPPRVLVVPPPEDG
jgi:hypothetical protein